MLVFTCLQGQSYVFVSKVWMWGASTFWDPIEISKSYQIVSFTKIYFLFQTCLGKKVNEVASALFHSVLFNRCLGKVSFFLDFWIESNFSCWFYAVSLWIRKFILNWYPWIWGNLLRLYWFYLCKFVVFVFQDLFLLCVVLNGAFHFGIFYYYDMTFCLNCRNYIPNESYDFLFVSTLTIRDNFIVFV